MVFYNKLLIVIILFLVSFSGISASFSDSGPESSTPRKAGIMTFKLNGVQYTADLYEEVNPYSYRILCGNKNYELQIEWKYAGSPADIKENIFDLSERGNDVSVKYINFDEPYNFTTSSGLVIVKNNDGTTVSGLFSFKANAENNAGSANNMYSFTDGTFEITYPAK